jgi:glycosyltransferase involved in cell wall biosynthesis
LSQHTHSHPELSVVIAVGDQEESIGHLIRNVASHLSRLGRSFEILIVNAGCKDNSLSIASVLAASMAPLAWALSRIAGGRDAVVLRGRYVVARRLAVLPVVVRAGGPGVLFEAVFESRAQELGVDIVGSRPRRPVPLLLRPVLRFLAA